MKRMGLLLCFIAVFGTAYVMLSGVWKPNKEAEVVHINGQPVSASEFKLILDRHRSEVYRYFNDKYGVKDSVSFWSLTINGENPGEMAKKLALKELVSWKVQLDLAQKYGLIPDSSYASFLDRLRTENKQRKEDQLNHKPVFGPLSFDEQTYYSYEKSNLTSQLKKTLAQQVWKVSDESFVQFYDQNKERLYKEPYTMKIHKAGISFLDRDHIANEQWKEESFQLLTQAGQAISNGTSFDKAIDQISKSSALSVVRGDQTFSPDTVLQDSRMDKEIWNAAASLQPGQVSDPIEAFDGAYYLIELTDKKDNGYKPFDLIRDQVEAAYLDQRYDEFLNKEIQQAKVEINQRSWSAIELR